ncbi:MAG: membrane protein insertase YidC [Bacteroidota bacterium]
MDRNTITGLVLIFFLLMAMSWFQRKSPEEIERMQFVQDSLRMEQLRLDSLEKLGEQPNISTFEEDSKFGDLSDSVKNRMLSSEFGAFAESANGTEKEVVLENELIRIVFNTKGAKIKEVLLKEYSKFAREEDGSYGEKVPLKLLEDEKNKFEYILPVSSAESNYVYTSDLYFTANTSSDRVVFRANAGDGRYFEQTFKLNSNSYLIDHDIRFVGMERVLTRTEKSIKLNWVNYLDHLEKNPQYEAMYSTVYYKEAEEDPSYCSCRKSVEEERDTPLKWVSHAQQFFNSTLIAKNNFSSANLTTEIYDKDAEDLKKLTSEIEIPFGNTSDENFQMQFFFGPNEFKTLKSLEIDLEDIIPFGWSIFGWINRVVIRPLFTFLAGFIGSYGVIILVLTLLVKLLLFPLTYKMLYSQAKMGALKPELAKLKEKIGDDQQKIQMEQMKLYRETGVSPLGGCMPMVLQMPIWFALYRFFPASIEFRQKGFLWADDLSSFDSIMSLPFDIPMYGAHVSLFTLLWAFTTVIYSYYNSKHMDFSANPMMKYIQYFMPIMFIVFFNSYSSGLTCYLFFSNVFNISSTIITKQFVIDNEKIKAELEANKKKPKKKGGFSERLEKAMKEQQAKQAQQAMESAKKRKEERKKKK